MVYVNVKNGKNETKQDSTVKLEHPAICKLLYLDTQSFIKN